MKTMIYSPIMNQRTINQFSDFIGTEVEYESHNTFNIGFGVNICMVKSEVDGTWFAIDIESGTIISMKRIMLEVKEGRVISRECTMLEVKEAAIKRISHEDPGVILNQIESTLNNKARRNAVIVKTKCFFELINLEEA